MNKTISFINCKMNSFVQSFSIFQKNCTRVHVKYTEQIKKILKLQIPAFINFEDVWCLHR